MADRSNYFFEARTPRTLERVFGCSLIGPLYPRDTFFRVCCRPRAILCRLLAIKSSRTLVAREVREVKTRGKRVCPVCGTLFPNNGESCPVCALRGVRKCRRV